MSTNTNAMSALEWFFRKPSASNFPHDTSSPELRQLRKDTDRLSIALLASDSEDAIQGGQHFKDWITRIDASDRISMSEINKLIEMLGKMANVINKIDKQVTTDAFNATVVALVILAKASQDIEFRKKVIALTKKLALE